MRKQIKPSELWSFEVSYGQVMCDGAWGFMWGDVVFDKMGGWATLK